MECLNNEKMLDYMDGTVTAMEQALIRDHLIVCLKCRRKHQQFSRLENLLVDPLMVNPPEDIEKNVMKRIYHKLPAFSSIIALIAASFLFLVSWIYIYFDFSNNSMIQALQLTSDSTSKFITSVIKVISQIFSSVYAIYKVINKFFNLVLHIDIGIEIFILSILILSSILFYAVFHLFFKRSREQKI